MVAASRVFERLKHSFLLFMDTVIRTDGMAGMSLGNHLVDQTGVNEREIT
jgi:hypothetical protein